MKASKNNRTRVFQVAVLGVVFVLIASWFTLAGKDVDRRRAELEALSKETGMAIDAVNLKMKQLRK